MPTLEERIISEIVSYVKQSGGDFSSWYVGIADDARSSMFKDHGVDEASGQWIFENAMTESCARRTGMQLMDTYNMKGSLGSGGYSATSVFAYRITPSTLQKD